MRVWVTVISAVILTTAAFGQPAETERKFEAADIHNSPRSTGGIPPVVRGPFYSEGRYELRFATMVDLISAAYGVDQDRITGGPNWLEMDRFDVFGKTSGAGNAESRKLMLQALLADRFK